MYRVVSKYILHGSRTKFGLLEMFSFEIGKSQHLEGIAFFIFPCTPGLIEGRDKDVDIIKQYNLMLSFQSLQLISRNHEIACTSWR